MSDAKQQAIAQVRTIVALVEGLDEEDQYDEAYDRIQEHPLSVEVRCNWVSCGEELVPEEFRIVLCTGGPHVEILGDLDEEKQPTHVRVVYKDFSENGELFEFDQDSILKYCQQFYFGE